MIERPLGPFPDLPEATMIVVIRQAPKDSKAIIASLISRDFLVAGGAGGAPM